MSKVDMRTIVVVGAGISGCVVAYELAKQGYKVILVEKDTKVGGLAKSFRYGNATFDVGPHRFFTTKQEVAKFIQDILGDEYTIISRDSSVYFLGKYYPWPLRPTVAFNLPVSIAIRSGWDLFPMGIKKRRGVIGNFENYMLEYYGPTLYNAFFKKYTQKFLGLSPQKTDSKWAKDAMKRTVIDESIASRNLTDILKSIFNFKPLQTKFIYPSQGMGVFCEKLVARLKRHNVEVWTDSCITDADCSNDWVKKIFIGGRAINTDKIIWTASMEDLCRLLKIPSDGLNYRALLLYNIELNKPSRQNYQWCYYGDKEIFSRISMPSLFNKNMGANDKASICVEVTCQRNDQWWNNPDKLVERIKKDLVRVKLVNRAADIGKIYMEKIDNAYPIYKLNYFDNLKIIKENLAKWENLILAGRTGLFWYNNMDDSIENALGIAKDIMRKKL